jgi:hypothetical protein
MFALNPSLNLGRLIARDAGGSRGQAWLEGRTVRIVWLSAAVSALARLCPSHGVSPGGIDPQ